MNNHKLSKICPICGKYNNCGADNSERCWCFEIDVPQKLINLVSEHKKSKACICLACIEEFKINPKKFLNKFNTNNQ